MKTTTLLFVAILMAWATTAQTTFTVPERDAEKYYPRASFIIHYSQTVALSYAKSMGQSAEEFGNYCGDLYKLTWNSNAGFNHFVKGTMYNLDVLSDGVEIVSQSEQKVVLRAKNFYSKLQKTGMMYDISYDDYIQFMQASHNRIAELLGCTIKFDTINDALEATIKPLQRKVVLNLFSPYMYWSPQNVNGWVKSIKYETFEGLEKNGKIVKVDKLKPSEIQSNLQRINETLYFDKKGNLTSYSDETNQYGHDWSVVLNHKNERVENMFFIKDGVPVSKGNMLYEKGKFLGSDWFSFENNELTYKWRVETDEHGNVNFRKGFNKNDVITSQGPKVVRDENGFAVEKSLLKNDGTIDWQVKISYDDNDLPVEYHRTINNGNEVDERFHCEYEFDENGNWVKQIQYGPPADKNFVIERAITFYKKRQPIKLDDETLLLYVGKYQLGSDFFIDITKEGNTIFAQATDQEKFEIAPFEKHKFFTLEFSAEFVFEPDKEGKVTGFTLYQNGEYKATKIE